MTVPEQKKYNDHQLELEDKMVLMKHYVNSPLNEWQVTSEKNGLILSHQKSNHPSGAVVFRGDYHYRNVNLRPLDMSSIIIFSTCRRQWDSKFDGSEIRVIRSRYSSLSYGKTKATWPAVPRDFSTITLRQVEQDGTLYFGLFSIEDDEINPPVAGFVRGQVICSGWKISRYQNGLMLTFINQLDMGGSVPPLLAKPTLQQVPQCVQKVTQYHDKYGFPPTTTIYHCQFLGEDFDHHSATYTLHLAPQKESNNTDAEVLCCHRMFPNGFDVVVVQGHLKYTILQQNTNQLVQLSNLEDKVTLQIIGKKKWK
ncbi:uncharacterized protein BX664DRAFT_388876 [Halteromyces radiatus]|uniref:uncharacterized protein n=1 Tax=Halteromyces radiatus TaxID=101107 RepID=UPI0022204052|nr:uncharacterized protein BX664DRAFT_388876 [Halteromyces radiatus]KAI8079918.1 hypothetical protein BX664DRAFT_388876 [Halteromyces radiatus]